MLGFGKEKLGEKVQKGKKQSRKQDGLRTFIVILLFFYIY